MRDSVHDAAIACILKLSTPGSITIPLEIGGPQLQKVKARVTCHRRSIVVRINEKKGELSSCRFPR